MKYEEVSKQNVVDHTLQKCCLVVKNIAQADQAYTTCLVQHDITIVNILDMS